MAQKIHLVEDENALTSLIWMLGEFGENVQETPYLLENLIFDWDNQRNSTKNQLATSCVKMFFKRPLEMKVILSQLFEKGLNDYSNPDVNERILFYYILLNNDVSSSKDIIQSVPPGITVEETKLFHEIDLLLEEFNTLSVIYGKPSEHFIVQFSSESISESSEDYSDENIENEVQTSNNPNSI